MSLPPLPDELARFTPTEGEHRALKMFVREYGQACREQALEEAINCYSPDDTATDLLDKIKAKIGVAP